MIVITFDSLVLSKINWISLAFDLISVSFWIFEFFSFPVPFFINRIVKNLNHPSQIQFCWRSTVPVLEVTIAGGTGTSQ